MAHKPTVPEGGENRHDKRLSAVLRVLEDAIAQRAFPGCAFGVLAGGEVVLNGALGQFTYEADSPAVEPETVWDVASVTKVVATTAMTMLLWQRGELDIDLPLGDVLPGFVIGRAAGDTARHVRLRHLLGVARCILLRSEFVLLSRGMRQPAPGDRAHSYRSRASSNKHPGRSPG